MRHGLVRLEKRKALHVLALSGPGQQYLWWQAVVIAHAAVLKPRCGVAQTGRPSMEVACEEILTRLND